ncbi:acetylglutamate kinase [Lawsonia intracellularis]|uniref:Acetylglutamate kinase n=1 Tax=Lawsonia intracellularis (strain PHE/MN1-00) TaxID=363253 RepID=ARGB_LAWIP|nr:acetylglutamate kinase [Lawsonia intracellularis]Q1MRI7.1 RecName: Full=Acetylglutamate kinase; AltName: Full=N-acetyl-L-glutamate 5-phosphotransferase; AltName: Full=NAG kinase; Short=NAGK [Lawsonia intracellularis PHE/MN1-00]AGC49746.1 acetylglutamate kinase [Lawsonia intracellularis N343]KAA0205252.1 acetylglutamate kinase [Lawsonia intracellularis]MBZ3892218.1 acetylglutamate kinase [Lawsonia intracellularis]RBN32201.1 acetylglutamate kinase [Lawsonia intracellularis]RBN33769.1 acetylg
MDMEKARLRSHMLIESLPYLQKFQGKVIVIKYGGHAMKDTLLKQSFAQSIALLNLVGIHPIVVHGGGPQIGNMLSRLNIQSEFREGLRVTDKATMDVVEMVLAGSVNKEIVNQVNQAGAKAVGLSGKDGAFILAEKNDLILTKENQPPEIINLGNVGRVVHIETSLLYTLIEKGFIPIIAPVGTDNKQTYNINADEVAGAIAGALKATRLLLLTDVEGILDLNKKLIQSIYLEDTPKLFSDGIVFGGMIPKLQCCIEAIEQGVEKVVILDGRLEHSILLELFTDQGVGTEIVKKPV